MEEFKYLGLLFISEGRREWEIRRQIGPEAVILMLHWFIVVRKGIRRKAKLLIVTKRMRSLIQAVEMSFP